MPPNKPQPNQPGQQKLTGEQQDELTSLVSKVVSKLDSLLTNSDVSTTIAKQQVQQTQHIIQNLPPSSTTATGTQPSPSKTPPIPEYLPTTHDRPQSKQPIVPQQPSPLGKATQRQAVAQNPFMGGFFARLASELARVFAQAAIKKISSATETKTAHTTVVKETTTATPTIIKQHHAKVAQAQARLNQAQQSGKGVTRAFVNVQKASAALEKAKGGAGVVPPPVAGVDKAGVGQTKPNSLGQALSAGLGHIRSIGAQAPDGAKHMQSLFKATGAFASQFGRTGRVFQSLSGFGEQVFKAVENLQQMNRQMHDFDMQFAPFSGAMAAVMAEQRVRDIQLAQQRGDRLAPTARLREESAHKLNVEMAKITDGFSAIKNVFQTGLNTIASRMLGLTGLPRIMERITEILNRIAEGSEADQAQQGIQGWFEGFGGNWGAGVGNLGIGEPGADIQ